MTHRSPNAPEALLAPDPTAMRHVMGHFGTGVAVITAHDGRRPVGFTCQSLTSVSLEPPLISFCPARTSSTWPVIRQLKRVCVNVLASDQRDLALLFAKSGTDRFSATSWRPASNGAPVLQGALAGIEAQFEAEHDAGDHTIVIARVTALQANAGRDPLLFFRGDFHSLAAADGD